MTLDELQAAYREARARGDSFYHLHYYERWVAAMCAAGKRPDALRRYEGTPTERFWARVVPGPDGHLFWDDKRDWKGRPWFVSGEQVKGVLAQRFAWRLRHGRLSNRVDVWATCGEQHCLNVEHLESGWRARGIGRGMGLRYTNGEIEAKLRVMAEHLGRPPSSTEWENARYSPNRTRIRKRYGSWAKALEAAGLPYREKPE